MLLAVLVQVVGRYFAFSIDWASESATLAQIWMVLLAAGLAMRDRLHVRVDAVLAVLPAMLVRLLTLIVMLACLWFLSLTIRGSLALIEVGLFELSPVLRLPMWIAFLALPLGLGYFALELVLAFASEAVAGLGDNSGEDRQRWS
jgi:TRAP-type C4-dicarboxylate transport system permease small subunit